MDESNAILNIWTILHLHSNYIKNTKGKSLPPSEIPLNSTARSSVPTIHQGLPSCRALSPTIHHLCPSTPGQTISSPLSLTDRPFWAWEISDQKVLCQSWKARRCCLSILPISTVCRSCLTSIAPTTSLPPSKPSLQVLALLTSRTSQHQFVLKSKSDSRQNSTFPSFTTTSTARQSSHSLASSTP